MHQMSERICTCFGDSGMHASTHTCEVAGRDRVCCDLCGYPIYRRWRVKFVAGLDLYFIGAFWHAATRKLYILPLPCLGFVLNFGDNP